MSKVTDELKLDCEQLDIDAVVDHFQNDGGSLSLRDQYQIAKRLCESIRQLSVVTAKLQLLVNENAELRGWIDCLLQTQKNGIQR